MKLIVYSSLGWSLLYNLYETSPIVWPEVLREQLVIRLILDGDCHAMLQTKLDPISPTENSRASTVMSIITLIIVALSLQQTFPDVLQKKHHCLAVAIHDHHLC